MLSQKDLVARLQQYDFSKFGSDVERQPILRPPGFGVALATLKTKIEGLVDSEYNRRTLDSVHGTYGFLVICYASIDFEEIEGNRDEIAVEHLFQTRTRLQNLGRCLGPLLTRYATSELPVEEKVTKETESYVEATRILQTIINSGTNSFYRERVRFLESELSS